MIDVTSGSNDDGSDRHTHEGKVVQANFECSLMAGDSL
jgi:hypothetical protein